MRTIEAIKTTRGQQYVSALGTPVGCVWVKFHCFIWLAQGLAECFIISQI